jgi:hypothetical protein
MIYGSHIWIGILILALACLDTLPLPFSEASSRLWIEEYQIGGGLGSLGCARIFEPRRRWSQRCGHHFTCNRILVGVQGLRCLNTSAQPMEHWHFLALVYPVMSLRSQILPFLILVKTRSESRIQSTSDVITGLVWKNPSLAIIGEWRAVS